MGAVLKLKSLPPSAEYLVLSETIWKLYFVLGDGRPVRIDIFEKPYGCLIEERFEAERQNDLHTQREGWHSILKNLVR